MRMERASGKQTKSTSTKGRWWWYYVQSCCGHSLSSGTHMPLLANIPLTSSGQNGAQTVPLTLFHKCVFPVISAEKEIASGRAFSFSRVIFFVLNRLFPFIQLNLFATHSLSKGTQPKLQGWRRHDTFKLCPSWSQPAEALFFTA